MKKTRNRREAANEIGKEKVLEIEKSRQLAKHCKILIYIYLCQLDDSTVNGTSVDK